MSAILRPRSDGATTGAGNRPAPLYAKVQLRLATSANLVVTEPTMIAGQFEAAQTNPVERTVPSQRATIPRWPDDPMTRWPDLSMTGSPADPISQTLHTTLNAARLQFLEA